MFPALEPLRRAYDLRDREGQEDNDRLCLMDICCRVCSVDPDGPATRLSYSCHDRTLETPTTTMTEQSHLLVSFGLRRRVCNASKWKAGRENAGSVW